MYQKAIYDCIVDARVDDDSPILVKEHTHMSFSFDELSALGIFNEIFPWYQEAIGAVATVVGLVPLAIYEKPTAC